MKILIISAIMLVPNIIKAQLYLNGDITIQNGAVLFANDTVIADAQSTINVNGNLETTKGLYTNFAFIRTGSTGFITCPIPPGMNKTIGMGMQQAVTISHTNGNNTSFRLALRDQVYQNPETNTSQITSNVVDKTWHVEPLSNVSNLTVTPGWNSINETTGFLRTHCNAAYWQHGSSTSWNVPAPAASATNTGLQPEFTLACTPMNVNAGIYYFGIGSTGSPLPVHFVDVTAAKNGNRTNLINWRVTNLLNGNYFSVERSYDGVNFEVAGTVSSRNASRTLTTYSFTDRPQPAEVVYYRIRHTDLDARVQLSNTVNVHTDSRLTAIVAYPNPARDHITLQCGLQFQAELIITNCLGVHVFRNICSTNTAVDISQLEAGIYYATFGEERFKIIID